MGNAMNPCARFFAAMGWVAPVLWTFLVESALKNTLCSPTSHVGLLKADTHGAPSPSHRAGVYPKLKSNWPRDGCTVQ